jgi:hypothetical protein
VFLRSDGGKVSREAAAVGWVLGADCSGGRAGSPEHEGRTSWSNVEHWRCVPQESHDLAGD